MGLHNLWNELWLAHLKDSQKALLVPGVGHMIGWGDTVPSAAEGWSPGAIFIHHDGTAGTTLYVNEGTADSSSFVVLVTPGNIDAQTLATQSTTTTASLFDTAFPAGGSNMGRGPSTGLWAACPVIDYMLDPTKGMVCFNDFHGGYALANNQTSTYLEGGVQGFTGATAGTTIASLTTDPNGVAVLSTTTEDESVGISLLGSKNVAGQFVLTSGKKSWFEARIKVNSIADALSGLFCGFAEEGLLAEDGVIGDDGALPDKDYIGFLRVEADGDKLATVHRKASGAGVVVKADAVTLVADTYIKIGFYCDGTTVTFYVNGTALADTCALATATVPTAEEMAFYFVLNGGDGDNATASIDWVRIAREF